MPDLQTFHEDVKRGNLDAVRTALTGDPALLDARNEAGQSAFVLAKYYGQQPTADYLLSLNPKLDVFTACIAGLETAALREIDIDRSLLEAHSNDGWTPLHLAAFFGHLNLAKELLERGANVDALSTNAMRNTPLHAAVAGGKISTTRVLIEHGGNVNARQHGGWTALQGAAQAGNRELVELLIASGADLHARADNNQSALDLALMKGRQDIAAMLEELGAKLR
jgi:uncharacterized protein